MANQITVAACIIITLSIKTLSLNYLFAPSSQSRAAVARIESLEAKQISDIINLIDKCPSWRRFKRNDVKMAKKIAEQLNKISLYNLSVIRKAVDQYSKEKFFLFPEDIDAQCRLFLLNRFLFTVSEDAPFEGRRFGGWTGRPESPGRINWLWPFSYKKDGGIELSDVYRGYMGHEYFALDEFDYFKEKFGPRKQSPKKQS